MRVLVALCLVTLSLAGCSDDAKPGEEPDAFQDAKATKETGVIRGVVVDETITPVVGATVTLVGQTKTATADADGAFLFNDMQPGTYFMTASAPYHTSVQSSAEVFAGIDKPPIVRMQLQSLPKPVPSLEVLDHRFFMDGSVWVGGAGGVVLGNFLGMGTFATVLEYGANATWVQSELTWESTTLLSEAMRMSTNIRDADGDAITGRTVAGLSPLIAVFGAEESPEDMARARQSAYTLFVYDGTSPVGVAMAQELNLYLHVFHHFTPPEGWQFGRDGTPSVPPPP